MRHFHDTLIGSHAFFTVFVDGVRYGVDPDAVLQKSSILGKLASCLEVPYGNCVRQFTSGVDPYEAVGLAPNEARAVIEFRDFFNSVMLAWNKPAGEESLSFQGTWLYTNLNEGKSVAWSVFLQE
jgi:hypothetical protein